MTARHSIMVGDYMYNSTSMSCTFYAAFPSPYCGVLMVFDKEL